MAPISCAIPVLTAKGLQGYYRGNFKGNYKHEGSVAVTIRITAGLKGCRS